MDPNQFQFQENFENVRQKKNASYFRMRAREFLNEEYGQALGVGFVAWLLGTLSGGLSVNLSIGDPSSMVFMIVTIVVVMLSAIAGSLFVTAPIQTGYARYNLGLADNRKPGFEDLFYYFKSGQYLRTVKLGALYMLVEAIAAIPMVICIALMSMFAEALETGGMLFGISSETVLAFAVIVLFVLMLASMVFFIVVQYRYYFAFYILADCPDITPRDALRNSATLMKGRKWKLFCLHLSFIGWLMLGALACGIGTFFLDPYLKAADAAFYDDASQRSKVDETEFPSIDPEDYDPNLAQW